MSERLFLPWAACREIPMDRYFPAAPIGDERDEITFSVRAHCIEACSVQSACAADALRRNAFHGVVASVDLGPGPIPRSEAVTELHRIANRITSY